MRECREFGDLDAVPAINALDGPTLPPIHRTADEKLTRTAAS